MEILILLLFIGVIFVGISYSCKNILFGLWGSAFLTGAIIGLLLTRTPSAIDVYRGKTTLKITYKNNIPIDSVVVFK